VRAGSCSPTAPRNLGADRPRQRLAGQRLSVRSIAKLVARVMTAADVDESAHGLRHTVATRLVRDHGRDLALVADILGHADVKTTRRYARSELDDRRAALEALDR
jgi:integrase/recombinase XerC